jgi:hypothetical protein
MDADEVFMPLSNSKSCSELSIYDELKKIKIKVNSSIPAYWFRSKVFIRFQHVQMIIRALNSSLYNKKVFKSAMNILTEKLIDDKVLNTKMNILIDNENDFGYARSLIEFSKSITRRNHSNPYEYLFSIKHDYEDQFWFGKSIYETTELLKFGHYRRKLKFAPIKMNVQSFEANVCQNLKVALKY